MSSANTDTRPKGLRASLSWLKQQLVQGRDPSKAAHAAAVGTTVGLLPLYGPTTIVCGLVGLKMKLNHAILQGFNYLISPLKVLMLIPFIRLGEAMAGAAPFPLTVAEVTGHFKQGMLHAVEVLAGAVLHGVMGWIVAAPLIYSGVYLIAKSLLLLRQRRMDPAGVESQA